MEAQKIEDYIMSECLRMIRMLRWMMWYLR